MRSWTLVSLALLSTHLYADQWSVATGIDTSSGKYGLAQDTHIQAEYLQVRYEKKDWLIKLTLPYLHIQSPADARLISDGSVVIDSSTQTKRHIEGWGDVTIAGSKSIMVGKQKNWGVELTSKIKLPTANRQEGLGTGKTDYTLQLDGYIATKQMTYFGSLGYKWIGQPSGVDYHDILLASVGMAYPLSHQLSLGFAIDYRQSPIPYLLDQTEGMLFVTQKLNARWQWQTYLYRGVNDASPDLGGGVMARRVF